MFLNHQHPTEYVLIFNEGQVYIRLHQAFEEKIWNLVKVWADDRKIKCIQWNFRSSCSCSPQNQMQKDADYYSKRGLFHLRRGNAELAYNYLKEAHTLDWTEETIKNNYAKALVALRKERKDSILDAYLERGEKVSLYLYVRLV